ncbi:MAG: FAD-binding oxidoreductase [Actinobacteria bacterium]|nr:MAG: FAD-binding oxidoreductase [Actinomycetota bacterium]
MSTSTDAGAASGARDVLLSGWGRTAPSRAELVEPGSREALAEALAGAGPRGVLARGLGRSYGDAAQNAGGRVVAMGGLAELREIDTGRGVVTVDAGMSIHDLTRELLPEGLFVPVSPGTAHVTVGGAIAADVHAKNHHRDGSFCDHVLAFELLTPSGDLVTVTPTDEPDLFAATAGGMGLTGVVLSATLRLLRVESAYMVVDRERAHDLDDVMGRMAERDHEYRYSVAWIDCLARRGSLGRSVLIRGDHAPAELLRNGRRDSALAPPGGVRLAAPPWTPPGLLRRSTVRVFNEVYYRAAPEHEVGRLEHLSSFFYPLDSVRNWNRIYGPSGFLQYQLVVPYGREDALRGALERLSGAGAPSFLAVLKRFGPQRGLMSFPIEGWTLALDVPAALPGLGALLDGLDELVAGAAGRVYLAKDSRLRPDMLAAMYPRLGEWRAVRERADPAGVMRSDLARRLDLT